MASAPRKVSPRELRLLLREEDGAERRHPPKASSKKEDDSIKVGTAVMGCLVLPPFVGGGGEEDPIGFDIGRVVNDDGKEKDSKTPSPTWP